MLSAPFGELGVETRFGTALIRAGNDGHPSIVDHRSSLNEPQMAILTRSLKVNDSQLNYDVEGKRLFVTNSTGKQQSVDDCLANDSEAQRELELLIMDMFPNELGDA